MQKEPQIDKPSLPLAIANIVVDDAASLPIYEQISRSIRLAISKGDLPPGTQLPTSRDLAVTLDVARNTVATAYLRLSAEGFVLSNKRRGTRVAEDWKHISAPVSRTQSADLRQVEKVEADRTAGEPQPCGISYRARELLDNYGGDAFPDPSAICGADVSLYPRNPLRQLLADEFCRAPARNTSNGTRRFQTAVATLLRQMRGVVCEPEQVMPVMGIESALNLVARVVIDAGDNVCVEDPTFPLIRQCLKGWGARLLPLPSDENGADVGRMLGPPPRLLCVSPSVGVPFGQQMSEKRRNATLEVARNWNSIIFENDSLWELIYDGARNQALQAREPRNVVYYSGFCQTLGPHIKTCYLVIPNDLVAPFSEMAQRIACGPEPFMLGALATFIESSDYALHARKLRAVYSQRLQTVVQAARSASLPVTVVEPSGGLYVTMQLDRDLDEHAICQAANRQGIAVAPLSRFYNQRNGFVPPPGIVLGLGSLPERSIEAIIGRLHDIIREAGGASLRMSVVA